MGVETRNDTLKKLLWLDTFMGASVGLAGLLLYRPAAIFLGFTECFVLLVSAITFLYACMACFLATRKTIPLRPLKLLIYANAFWAVVSIILIFLYFNEATLYGRIFLVLQVLVVGGLGWAENRALNRV